jgi:hypothetical protein
MEFIVGILMLLAVTIIYLSGYYIGINKIQKEILGSYDELINNIEK